MTADDWVQIRAEAIARWPSLDWPPATWGVLFDDLHHYPPGLVRRVLSEFYREGRRWITPAEWYARVRQLNIEETPRLPIPDHPQVLGAAMARLRDRFGCRSNAELLRRQRLNADHPQAIDPAEVAEAIGDAVTAVTDTLD